MRSFLKMFFAALLAIVAFTVIVFFFFLGLVSSAMRTEKEVSLNENSVLVLDLNKPLREQPYLNPLNAVLQKEDLKIQGLHEVVRSIKGAAGDDHIEGIYLKLNGDPNGFATNEELRRALLDFKRSGKFIYAYGDVISQKAYYVGSLANKIFLNPQGMLDFSGFSMKMIFLKGTLDKLDIKPQIFYEGKFKSATEPFRVKQMTEANKIQTREYLGDLYQHFLAGIGEQRHIDTASLFDFANEGKIQSAADALQYGLVDGLKYKDEVMNSLREKLDISRGDDIPFVEVSEYKRPNYSFSGNSQLKIAILYAEGDIVNGHNESGALSKIAADDYVHLFKKLREDSSIKAIVFRVNSPGGSALASDEIWRALMLTRQIKPVVVSMGDFAASGGYYISCAADSIFAEPNTLTGSIGVFGIIPNLQSFFKNKLGVTFDGVKTAQYADLGTITRPLTNTEKQFIQASIDSVYTTFKRRVINGRDLPPTVVDSIAQGRVWSGVDALRLGLVDRLGGLHAAVNCAKRMANLSSYSIAEYPKPEIPYQKLLSSLTGKVQMSILKNRLGENYAVFKQLEQVTHASGEIMARLPFEIRIK